ncbi:MAG: hypothetical protein NT039_02195 [Candidatus Berkelbacteria bacterium]|nr:hypothetical protein [Candidatus Berkelbacteria bacterium]
MKKILFLFLAATILLPEFAVAQEPPMPGPVTLNFNSAIWQVSGNYLKHRVPRTSNTGTIVDPPLEVYYIKKGTGNLTNNNNPSEQYGGSTLYMLSYSNLDGQGFGTRDFTGQFYIPVDANGKIVGVFHHQRGSRGQFTYHYSGGGTQNLYRFDYQDLGDSAFEKQYMEPTIKQANTNPQTTTPPGSGTSPSCEQQFGWLKADMNSLKAFTYEFIVGQNQDQRYWRPRKTGENIGEDMQRAINAFKAFTQRNSGELGKMLQGYDLDAIVFYSDGLAKMQELGNISVSISQKIKYLEDNCRTYIDNKNNYPFRVNKYDPALPPKELQNWQEVVDEANKAIDLAQAATTIPQISTGPLLGGGDWVTKAINTIKCWLLKIFIVVFQYEANAMGWILRRNY